MKKALIVTFELNNPGRNYESLLKRIQAYSIWARLNGSTYIILVDDVTTVAQHRDYLVKALSQKDKIYISTLGREAAWTGLTDEVSNWIKQNQ